MYWHYQAWLTDICYNNARPICIYNIPMIWGVPEPKLGFPIFWSYALGRIEE